MAFPLEEQEHWLTSPNLYEIGTVKGLYEPMRFVVRLHSKLQNDLSPVVTGVYGTNELSSDSIMAFSTYFHETIHWWQHIGSTIGLMMSLYFPSQTHVNYSRLKTLNSKIGPQKSLRSFQLKYLGKLPKELDETLNIVLHNWFDIEFCYNLILDPHNIKKIMNSPYYESIGHSYAVMWASCVWLIAQSSDPRFQTLPNPERWESEFRRLRGNKIVGHYYGSPVFVAPIGAKAIFEGQARFSQLQYLYFASGKALEWQSFKRFGMLSGIYTEAFELFLKLIQEKWPNSVDDPLIALFLLVCELAINPTEGFPFEIQYFDSFIPSVDPGIRFCFLAQAIKEKYTYLKNVIINYSKEEYTEVSELLCQALICPTPIEAAETIITWPQKTNEFSLLMDEDLTFRFSDANLPVRLFVSRFINFQKDKLAHPEFFTWPGVWCTGRKESDSFLDQATALFNRNEALFLDAPDGEIRPRLIKDRPESNIYETFNQFYAWNANYSLVRQWNVVDGPFKFDFNWITKRYTKEEMISWATEIFKSSFGVSPKDFTIL